MLEGSSRQPRFKLIPCGELCTLRIARRTAHAPLTNRSFQKFTFKNNAHRSHRSFPPTRQLWKHTTYQDTFYEQIF